MSAENMSVRKELSAAVVTEAAAWVARLHGPLRTPTVENGFRNWLKEDPEHAQAFELVTESWDDVGALKGSAQIRITVPSDHAPVPARRKSVPLALAAASGAAAILAALYFLKSSDVTTGIGEQRVLSLDDGSRIYMNTQTQVDVDYSSAERLIHLKSGEALFEVAPQSGRPFVVSAGNRRIEALGTSFVVRQAKNILSVTLMEGKVSISPPPRAGEGEGGGMQYLTPGQRLTLAAHKPAALDTPPLEKITAWQRGKVPIDNLSLTDAIAEMNRYSRVRLVVERPESEGLRVSGIFRAGDSLSFARAVSKSYGLTVEESDRQIVLAGAPPE